MPSYLNSTYTMPISTVEVVTPPAEEPITLAEAKNYLKVDFNDDDALINLMITAAREQAEEYCKRSFVTQTVRYTLDVPYNNITNAYNYWFWYFNQSPIYLPKPEIQSVSSVVFYSTYDVAETVDATKYELDIPAQRLFLKYQENWPTQTRNIKTVEITYTAGYGGASDVPASIKMALLSHVLVMYDGRTICSMPKQTKEMLRSPYRIYNRLATNERL